MPDGVFIGQQKAGRKTMGLKEISKCPERRTFDKNVRHYLHRLLVLPFKNQGADEGLADVQIKRLPVFELRLLLFFFRLDVI